MPLVSVVIPCYNSEQFVGEAIQSALRQTYPHVEVIVIDDGSTDRSLAVIHSFGDAIHWEAGPNRGACAARNRGLELARGEYIQFLDADDTLYPCKIEQQLPASLSRENTLVFCDAESDGVPHPHHVRKDACDDAVLFMLNGGLQTSAPLHRRWWLEGVGGFNEDLPSAQERDLHLRIAAAGIRFQWLPEVLYRVRRVAGSISSNLERVLDQHSRIVWPIFHDLKQRGELTEARRKAFAGLLARDARLYLRRGHKKKAHEYFRQAAEMHPQGGLDSAYGIAAGIARRFLGAEIVERLGAIRRDPPPTRRTTSG